MPAGTAAWASRDWMHRCSLCHAAELHSVTAEWVVDKQYKVLARGKLHTLANAVQATHESIIDRQRSVSIPTRSSHPNAMGEMEFRVTL